MPECCDDKDSILELLESIAHILRDRDKMEIIFRRDLNSILKRIDEEVAK